MIQQLKISIVILLIFTLLTGVLYPLAVTVIAQLVFPQQANGSVIQSANKNIGSVLIGQEFTDAKYFWGRPSATGPNAYNAAASTGSNLGPTNPAQLDAVKARVAALKAAHANESAKIPVDLVTASASGLDPDISPAAAKFQIARVAKERGLELAVVEQLVQKQIIGRTFGVLGEQRVNVLQLNLALEQLSAKSNAIANATATTPSKPEK